MHVGSSAVSVLSVFLWRCACVDGLRPIMTQEACLASPLGTTTAVFVTSEKECLGNMVRCWDMAGQLAERRGRDPRGG